MQSMLRYLVVREKLDLTAACIAALLSQNTVTAGLREIPTSTIT